MWERPLRRWLASTQPPRAERVHRHPASPMQHCLCIGLGLRCQAARWCRDPTLASARAGEGATAGLAIFHDEPPMATAWCVKQRERREGIWVIRSDGSFWPYEPHGQSRPIRWTIFTTWYECINCTHPMALNIHAFLCSLRLLEESWLSFQSIVH